MHFVYNGYYFKLKSLKDYKYLSNEQYSQLQWNIVKKLYNYLKSQNKLQLYNELTSLSIKQQNKIIIESFIIPSSYITIYVEK
jgi:hypothetical protein